MVMLVYRGHANSLPRRALLLAVYKRLRSAGAYTASDNALRGRGNAECACIGEPRPS